MKRPDPTYATLPSGSRLHYRIQGHPGAPWMVLLNGLLSDTTMWAGILGGLTDRFRVLTFDSRGQGRSDAPGDAPISVEAMARDAWELLQILGISRPWLLGLSNGSSISLELLAARPGSFAGAVLTSCMPCIDFATRLRILHWIQCLDLGGPLVQFDAAAPYLWGDRFLERRHAVLRAYHQVVTGGAETARDAARLGGARRQMEGVLQWDIRDRLSAVKDPVLLLCGAEDLLTPPWKCLATAQGIPHSRFEMVPGIGHALPVEDPQTYLAHVLAFVDEMTTETPCPGETR